MKAHKSIMAIAVSAIAATSILVNSSSAIADANTQQSVTVYGIAVPVDHQGPGVGNMKSSPFFRFDKVPNQTSDVLFHTSDNAPAEKTVHVGPGLGSQKMPGTN